MAGVVREGHLSSNRLRTTRKKSCKDGGEWVPGPGDSRLRGSEVGMSLACWRGRRKPGFQGCSEPWYGGRREGGRGIQEPDRRDSFE